ncbi:MAG: hypothetical protein KKB70_01235 [Proteobacteria bacterium]|nr:hypothetical protein [Pseudomonadota bacterium]MBU1612562.1 hypothetical protein [Pseudomonadota bacterium]
MIRLLFTIARGMSDMARHPLANLFTMLAVTMVAVLAGVFLMLLHNVNQELLRTRGQVEFQLYWKVDTEQQTVDQQWKRLSRIKGLKSIETFTPSQALVELGQTLTGPTDFSWIQGQNPLPASAFLAFGLIPGDEGTLWANGLLQELKALPGMDEVHYNPFQLDLAHGWITLVRNLLWPIIGVLGLVVGLVVGNTMRLSLLTRQDEIEILSLVGAKPWYIRGPLLAAGALQGMIGSGLALGILKLGQLRLAETLNFAPLYLKISYLPLEQWTALAGIVTLVAMLSSFVAVRK